MSGIHVAQVIDAVNESVDATRCQGQGDCHSGDTCLTHHLWCDLSLQIHEFLSGISLADLVSRQEVRRSRCARTNAVAQARRLVSTRLKRPPSTEQGASL